MPAILGRGAALLAAAGLLTTAASLAGPTAYATTAPTISSPTDGDAYCLGTSEQITLAGTGPVSQTVTIDDNGSQLTTTTTGGQGNWSTKFGPWGAGSHSLTATADDGSGPASSAPTNITVAIKKSASLALSRGAISPANHDGVKDSVTLASTAPADGDMRFLIEKRRNVVRSSGSMPVTTDQAISWVWNGKNAAGGYVSSGRYKAVLEWAQTSCPSVKIAKDLTVDNKAPAVAAVGATWATFYPRKDDAFTAYRDSDVLQARRLSEDAKVAVEIWPAGDQSASHTVSLGTTRRGHNASYRWNGRRSNGAIMPTGRYDYRFRVTDGLGNVRDTAIKSVTLSMQHLVAKTTTVTKAGGAYSGKAQSNACGMDVSKSLSEYSGGVWLNYCGFYSSDVSVIGYQFGAPHAAWYQSEQPFVYGKSDLEHNRLPVVMVNFGSGKDAGDLAGASEGLHMLKTRYASSFVSNRGTSRLVVGFAGRGNYEYDIRDIGIKYRYGVLQA